MCSHKGHSCSPFCSEYEKLDIQMICDLSGSHDARWWIMSDELMLSFDWRIDAQGELELIHGDDT
jgi:hypothetical protein